LLSDIGHSLHLEGHGEKLFQSGITVVLNAVSIGRFANIFDSRHVIAVKSEFNTSGLRNLRSVLFLNSVVVVVDNLYRNLEFVKFSLHELLRGVSQEFESKFNLASLHNLAALLDILLFSILNNLPKLVRYHISALV